MDLCLVDEFTLEDHSKRFMIKVEPENLIYLGYILESFEGWCNYTTPDNSEPILQVDVTADYIQDMQLLLESLKKWEYQK